MKNIEEILNLKKLEIDNIEVPEELEGRLRNALHLVEVKTNKPTQKLYWLLRHKVMAAVILFMILISGLNYDVFAFYGKKILGYDQVTSGSFKELNELGRGQEINKSYKFKNGTEVIVDGVMFDKNKLSIMYSIRGESKEKIKDLSVPPSLNGIFKNYKVSNGSGIMSDDGREIKWIHNFEPPSIFGRNVTFTIRSKADDISKGEKGRIRFKINMDKAIRREVNSVINKTIEAQGVKYNFTTLSATQMSVLIDGTIQIGSEKDKELFGNYNNGVERKLNLQLFESYIKDGKVVTEVIEGGLSSMGSHDKNIKFQFSFDGLKPNIKSLTLNVLSTDDMRFIDKNLKINISTRNIRVVEDSEELLIKDVKEEGGNTIVTFIGQEDVIFDTALFIGEVQVKELEMNSKIIDDKARKVLEKTYKFEGTAKDMNLMFKTLSHRSNINKLILLYEEK